MKKEWQQPVLEVLDVNQTMAGTHYKSFDGNWAVGQPVPLNASNQPLIGS
ncbi:paeninodin family lasso peptide [Bacillus sp. BRMEA1]|nr:paeninodin family lasso peptide [Neobacillus endophyticus]NRD76975.1 paeninodin family lasso peptide [Neobacillus endophyticus]